MIDILYIVENANLRGGTEILTFNLVHALLEKRINASILSIIPYTGNDKNVISLNEKDYICWKKYETAIWNKLAFNIFSDRYLCSLIRNKIKELKPKFIANQTYDIITSLPTDIDCIAQVFNWSVVGYEKSVRNIITQKSFINRIISGYCNWGVTIRRHRILANIPKLIILTQAAKNELKGLNSRIKDEQIVVIPDPLPYKNDSTTISTLNNHNIIFVGRLSHEKGVMRLLRIWKKINTQLPNYSLSIYGEGIAKNEMLRYIKKEKINNVKFMGFSSDLESIYKNADLLCMTSDTEGFGMVLIESMYYGVPCISFDCPISPKEIISDAGIIVSCFDETMYANEICNLLKKPHRMVELQEKSITIARNYYMDKILERWTKTFK